MQQSILSLDGVETLSFVSKEDAARIFKEEFGEDIGDVLDFNPLPPSFKVGLRPSYRTADLAQTVADRVQAIAGVESVKYRKDFLEILDRRARTANSITLGLGIFISLSAVLLVSNTIRLAIYAKRKIIRTMELVGATRMFIRAPFVLEGVLQGVLGGCVAAAILVLLLGEGIRFVSPELAAYLEIPPTFFALVVGAGAVLGFVGSLISVARFIRAGSGA
jgi:cell division transport system permease protein